MLRGLSQPLQRATVGRILFGRPVIHAFHFLGILYESSAINRNTRCSECEGLTASYKYEHTVPASHAPQKTLPVYTDETDSAGAAGARGGSAVMADAGASEERSVPHAPRGGRAAQPRAHSQVAHGVREGGRKLSEKRFGMSHARRGWPHCSLRCRRVVCVPFCAVSARRAVRAGERLICWVITAVWSSTRFRGNIERVFLAVSSRTRFVCAGDPVIARGVIPDALFLAHAAALSTLATQHAHASMGHRHVHIHVRIHIHTHSHSHSHSHTFTHIVILFSWSARRCRSELLGSRAHRESHTPHASHANRTPLHFWH